LRAGDYPNVLIRNATEIYPTRAVFNTDGFVKVAVSGIHQLHGLERI